MSGGKISQSNTGAMTGGMQAIIGNENNQAMSSQGSPAITDESTMDLVKILAQIQDIIGQSDLPVSIQEKTKTHLDSAKLEVEAQDGDKPMILAQLGRAFKTVKEADSALQIGKRILNLVSPLFEKAIDIVG